MSVVSDWWPAVLLLTVSVRPVLARLPSGTSRVIEAGLPLTGRWLRSFLATGAALLLSLLIPLGYVSGVWLAEGMSLARLVFTCFLPMGIITAGGYGLAVSWTPRADERRERWLPVPREYLLRLGVAWLAFLLAGLTVPMGYYSSTGHGGGAFEALVGWKSLLLLP